MPVERAHRWQVRGLELWGVLEVPRIKRKMNNSRISLFGTEERHRTKEEAIS